MKKLLPVLLAPLLLAGCATMFTNLTPQRQVRNDNHLYRVEVALNSRQQTLRWESIQPFVNVGNEAYPMRPIRLLTNRWEALLPIPATKSAIQYRYKFDFKYNVMGKPPQNDSVSSPEYTLTIEDK